MKTLATVALLATLISVLVGGCAAADDHAGGHQAADHQATGDLDRTVLPIQEPEPKQITTLDAREAIAPPHLEVKAPKGAPNVVIVLLDDIGFGSSSAFATRNTTPGSRSATSCPSCPSFVRRPGPRSGSIRSQPRLRSR